MNDQRGEGADAGPLTSQYSQRGEGWWGLFMGATKYGLDSVGLGTKSCLQALTWPRGGRVLRGDLTWFCLRAGRWFPQQETKS